MQIFDSLCSYIREKYCDGDEVQLAAPRTDDDIIISKNGLNYFDSKRSDVKIQNYKRIGNMPLSLTPVMKKFYLLTTKINTPYCRIFDFNYLIKKHKVENSLNLKPCEFLIGGIFKLEVNGISRLINVENQAHKLPDHEEEDSFFSIDMLVSYFEQMAAKNDCEEKYLISSKDGIISAIVDGVQLITKDIDLNELFSNDNSLNIRNFLSREIESYDKSPFYIINVKRGSEMFVTMNIIKEKGGEIILKSTIIEPRKTFRRLNAPCTSEGELSFNGDIKEKPFQLIRRAIQNSRKK